MTAGIAAASPAAVAMRASLTPGATYNLARSYEAQGRVAKAISTLAQDKTSPQRFGNRLRAKWLRSLHSEDQKPEPPSPLDDEEVEDEGNETDPPADDEQPERQPNESASE